MINNMFKDMRTDRVNRIDVNFDLSDKKWDNLIGRAGHLEFIENVLFIKMIVMIDEFFN